MRFLQTPTICNSCFTQIAEMKKAEPWMDFLGEADGLARAASDTAFTPERATEILDRLMAFPERDRMAFLLFQACMR